MLQESPSGVYQPGPKLYYPKIHMSQPTLDVADSSFASSEILALELLLHLSGTPMNITILDYYIHYIPYIYQVP